LGSSPLPQAGASGKRRYHYRVGFDFTPGVRYRPPHLSRYDGTGKARNQADMPVNPCPGAKLDGSSGGTHSGEQEGESQPFRGWKGEGISRLRTWKGSLRRLWSNRTMVHKNLRLLIYLLRLY